VSRLNGHHEVVKLLLAKGATVDQTEEETVEEEEGEGSQRSKVRVCENCGKEGEKLKKCSACKLVWYCSEECQLGDWKAHKVECKRARQELK